MSGALVWFTGLPSSGKSRLARRVLARLQSEQRPCCLLDGDRFREILHPKPGYSPEARDDFYLTLGLLAAELSEQGLVVLVAATAHRRAHRERVRTLAPRSIEVWLDAPIDECRRRDAKGLYEGFARGQVHDLPGEDLAYEPPESPQVRAFGGDDERALAQIIEQLKAPAPGALGPQ